MDLRDVRHWYIHFRRERLWYFFTRSCQCYNSFFYECYSLCSTFVLLKVLLPLVNVPMIDYTLAWLESAGVEEVFVFCCAHAKQVVDFLDSSKWVGQANFSVTTIESHNSVSAGDALRLIYERNVVTFFFLFFFTSILFHILSVPLPLYLPFLILLLISLERRPFSSYSYPLHLSVCLLFWADLIYTII